MLVLVLELPVVVEVVVADGVVVAVISKADIEDAVFFSVELVIVASVVSAGVVAVG